MVKEDTLTSIKRVWAQINDNFIVNTTLGILAWFVILPIKFFVALFSFSMKSVDKIEEIIVLPFMDLMAKNGENHYVVMETLFNECRSSAETGTLPKHLVYGNLISMFKIKEVLLAAAVTIFAGLIIYVIFMFGVIVSSTMLVGGLIGGGGLGSVVAFIGQMGLLIAILILGFFNFLAVILRTYVRTYASVGDKRPERLVDFAMKVGGFSYSKILSETRNDFKLADAILGHIIESITIGQLTKDEINKMVKTFKVEYVADRYGIIDETLREEYNHFKKRELVFKIVKYVAASFLVIYVVMGFNTALDEAKAKQIEKELQDPTLNPKQEEKGLWDYFSPFSDETYSDILEGQGKGVVLAVVLEAPSNGKTAKVSDRYGHQYELTGLPDTFAYNQMVLNQTTGQMVPSGAVTKKYEANQALKLFLNEFGEVINVYQATAEDKQIFHR